MFDCCASEARGVRQAALRALIRLSVYTFKLVRFADALIMPDRRASPIPSPSQCHSSCTRIKFNYPDIVVTGTRTCPLGRSTIDIHILLILVPVYVSFVMPLASARENPRVDVQGSNSLLPVRVGVRVNCG